MPEPRLLARPELGLLAPADDAPADEVQAWLDTEEVASESSSSLACEVAVPGTCTMAQPDQMHQTRTGSAHGKDGKDGKEQQGTARRRGKEEQGTARRPAGARAKHLDMFKMVLMRHAPHGARIVL